MRYASLILPVLSAALFTAACATSDSEPINDTSPAEPAPEATSMPPSSTPPAPAKQCVDKCNTDSDCQSSCPSVTNGVQCCDTTTGKCFASAQSTCPQPDPTPTDPTPAY